MELGQYYTSEQFSTLLVDSINSVHAENVLDIGCGQASLLNAARRRWNKAKLIGYDIDSKNLHISGDNNLHIEFGNGLDSNLSKKIIDNFGYIDISVANPPYVQVDVNSHILDILKRSKLSECLPRNIKRLPAEIIFLAQNILVLKPGGELGAILPASIISGERWKGLREFLITEKSLSSVIQLPSNAFSRTEASTFVINLKNEPKLNQNINLFSTQNNTQLKINIESGIKRLDFFYHMKKLSKRMSALPSDTIIFRGKKSSKELKSEGGNYLHTSHLKDPFQFLEYKDSEISSDRVFAKKGDFVVSRVGSRCIGRSGYIKSGSIEVSDCVTIIRRLPESKYLPLFQSGRLLSDITTFSLGTGAKYLTFNIIKEALEAYEL
jgi:tRNA1(Val) A37 N6-methylase TrmN6